MAVIWAGIVSVSGTNPAQKPIAQATASPDQSSARFR
jgi:hypothetical protein